MFRETLQGVLLTYTIGGGGKSSSSHFACPPSYSILSYSPPPVVASSAVIIYVNVPDEKTKKFLVEQIKFPCDLHPPPSYEPLKPLKALGR